MMFPMNRAWKTIHLVGSSPRPEIKRWPGDDQGSASAEPFVIGVLAPSRLLSILAGGDM